MVAILFAVLLVIFDAEAMLHRELAQRCCPAHFEECCASKFMFNEPLQCKGLHFHQLAEISSCVAQTLNYSTSAANFRDVKCCLLTYMDDLNDKEGKCIQLCHDIFRTPTLSTASKLQRMRECRIDKGMFPCFERCLQFYQKPHHGQEFRRVEHGCDLTPLLPEFPLIMADT
ncbi:her-1 domain-containing protein [Ditylenchus destructor]|uniref:Her-1 domain-containing protein n=1 Tax=Ditylenchus destructor TaxID=166010 RepID=A0AAD4MYV8_9BILA|nr:her-1 domain-containing protein [Ditylenchus destructor]